MNPFSTLCSLLYAVCWVFGLSTLLIPQTASAEGQIVRIGVMAIRGPQEALNTWTPTANYLSAKIPGYSFVIVPLTIDDIGPAVEFHDVEFVLTNPGSYAELESAYGVTRIATLKNKRPGGSYSVFGAVIFTRADRKDIQGIADLKGKTFMAVHESAFGGWWMAWRELKHLDIDPMKDFKKLVFSGFPQDNVVYAVRDGKVDAGTVRTDILEDMAEAGKINLKDFKILNPRHAENFPYALSTQLYPEWPFAVVRHTPDNLAQRVAVALISMPADSPSAIAAGYHEWTIPMDYHEVQQLMLDLHVGPYAHYGKVPLKELFNQYKYWLAAISIVLLVLATILTYVMRLNRKLVQAKDSLEAEIIEKRKVENELRKTQDGLELRVQERTAELAKINEELESRVARRTAQLLQAMQRLEADLFDKNKTQSVSKSRPGDSD